jgi:hypothetical protein
MRAYQRQCIDLLPRPALDFLSVIVTGILLKELSKMERFEIQNNPENICRSLQDER